MTIEIQLKLQWKWHCKNILTLQLISTVSTKVNNSSSLNEDLNNSKTVCSQQYINTFFTNSIFNVKSSRNLLFSFLIIRTGILQKEKLNQNSCWKTALQYFFVVRKEHWTMSLNIMALLLKTLKKRNCWG